jgi:hypothetical protein
MDETQPEIYLIEAAVILGGFIWLISWPLRGKVEDSKTLDKTALALPHRLGDFRSHVDIPSHFVYRVAALVAKSRVSVKGHSTGSFPAPDLRPLTS